MGWVGGPGQVTFEGDLGGLGGGLAKGYHGDLYSRETLPETSNKKRVRVFKVAHTSL